MLSTFFLNSRMHLRGMAYFLVAAASIFALSASFVYADDEQLSTTVEAPLTTTNARFLVTGLPPSVSCTYVSYKGTYPSTVTQSQSGVCSTNDWDSYADNNRMTLFYQSPLTLTVSDYWLAVTVGSIRYYTLYHWNGTQWSWESPPDVTRIITVFPSENSTTTSTSTIGATYYVSSDDFEDGMYLQMSFTNQTVSMTGGSALDAWNAAFGAGLATKIPITVSGSIVTATTSVYFPTNGITSATYKIVQPSFLSSLWFVGDLFNGTVLDTRDYKFVVNAYTGLDAAYIQGGTALTDYLLTGTTTNPVLQCDLFGGDDLTACLVSLVVPSNDIIKQQFQSFYNQTLSVFPVGYITRFMSILLLTDEVLPPALSYSFGSSSPQVLQDITENDPVEFQIWDKFDKLETAYSDQGGTDNLWDIIMPYFNTVVAFAVLLVILYDILGFEMGVDKTQHYTSRFYQKKQLGKGKTFESEKTTDVIINRRR